MRCDICRCNVKTAQRFIDTENRKPVLYWMCDDCLTKSEVISRLLADLPFRLSYIYDLPRWWIKKLQEE